MKGSWTTRTRTAVFASVLATVLFFVGCSGKQPSLTVSGPSSPMSIVFSFPDGPPSLGQEAKLLCTVDTLHRINMVDLRVWVVLPGALQLVSGNLSWEGIITANPGERIPTVDALVKAVAVGDWELRVHGNLPRSSDANFGPEGYPVYLAISRDKAEYRLNPSYGNTSLPTTQSPTIIVTVAPTNGSATSTSPGPTVQHALSAPVEVLLSVPEPPLLHQPVDLTCSVNSTGNFTGVSIAVKLPTGAASTGGQSGWRGDLKAGEPRSFIAQVVFDEPGKWTVEASAVSSDNRSVLGTGCLYLSIGTQASEIGWPPTPPRVLMAKQGDGKIIALNDGPAAFDPPDYFKNIPPPPTTSINGTIQPTQEHHSITVYGYFRYWTKSGDYRDIPDTLVPAKNYLVELRDNNSSHLTWGYSDSDGYFSIGGVNPSGGVKARFYAYRSIAGDELRVIYQGDSLSGLQDVYATSDTPTFQWPDDGGAHFLGDVELGQGFDGDGAFWIKDDLQRAYLLPSYLPGSGTVLWTETSQDGDYFWAPNALIHLRGVAERAPDVVVHEYGHRVMYNWYGGFVPPGTGPNPHFPGDLSSQGFAWKEGWADFFALAVNRNPYYTTPEPLTWDFETPSFGYLDPVTGLVWNNGDAVEGRVAGALWDLYDALPDGYDQFQAPAVDIWQIVATGPMENTFAQFWDSFKILVDQNSAGLAIYQNTISGNLRLQTVPAVPTDIWLNGTTRDSWGLNWVKLAPGSYTVGLTDVQGYQKPTSILVNGVSQPLTQLVVVPVGTTLVEADFIQLGNVHFTTSPAVPGTIYLSGGAYNNTPLDDCGAWPYLAAADTVGTTYTVSYGNVNGYDTPATRSVTVYRGANPDVVGTYVSHGGQTYSFPQGTLRLETVPALPSLISLNGLPRDNWGLSWVKLDQNNYALSVSDVQGFQTPTSILVRNNGGNWNSQPISTPISVISQQETDVQVNFTRLGNLHVLTTPAVPATLYCNVVPMDDWGFWTNLTAGQYTVSFQPLAGFNTPPPITVSVTPGNTTQVTGNYNTGVSSSP